MIEGACHCGAVRLRIAHAPAYRNDCQCDHCQKRGALWSYFGKADVEVDGETGRYSWGQRNIIFHFCPTCGCTTHWSPANPERDRMGVNTRLLDRAAMVDIPIRQSPGPR